MGLRRSIFILVAVFAVLHTAWAGDKAYSIEDSLDKYDNAKAKLEDLDNTTAEDNIKEETSPLEETQGGPVITQPF